jgi:hypothetical protein
MVDAADLKSAVRKDVGVQVPPRVPVDKQILTNLLTSRTSGSTLSKMLPKYPF